MSPVARVDRRRVVALEGDVVEVDVERRAVRLPHRADLVGIAENRLWQDAHLSVLHVEHARRRDVLPLPVLAVHRPVGLHQQVRVDRRQPCVVLGEVVDGRGAVQVADGLAVVGELGEVLPVVGDLIPGVTVSVGSARHE